jgi:plastocyanin
MAPVRGATVSGKIEIASAQTSSDITGQGLSDVVVWLQPVRAIAGEFLRPEHVQLVQKDKMFHPHTLAVDVGSTVEFPNKDPIFHNAFSNFDGQLFDVSLYPPGTSRSVHMHKTGIVRVFCNIHPSMSAVIVVLDTPYFTKAAPDGHYRIVDVPEGTYKLHVFDEQATDAQGSVGTVTVESASSEVAAPTVRLSEAGYVRLPHKNKYGLDYPPSSDDTSVYHGLDK